MNALLLLAHLCGIAGAFVRCPVSSRRRHSWGLFGVDEWRTRHGGEVAAPLVLLPFEPSQVILPGQVTTLEFKHGKFMDLIYDAIETRDSVIGLSILSDDGLLPVCVLAEVIEDELDMRMCYRGFSSMSVGIRAVGRAYQVKEVPGSDNLRARTAQEAIHIGQFVEYEDRDLTDEQMREGREILDEVSLSIPHNSDSYNATYHRSYHILKGSTRTKASVDDEQLALQAWSWTAISSMMDIDSERRTLPQSVIGEAIETRSTLNRLKIAKILFLENASTASATDRTPVTELDDGNAFQ